MFSLLQSSSLLVFLAGSFVVFLWYRRLLLLSGHPSMNLHGYWYERANSCQNLCHQYGIPETKPLMLSGVNAHCGS